MQDRMHAHEIRGLETSLWFDSESTEKQPPNGIYECHKGTCPTCGEAIDGLDADRRTTVRPCGHSVSERTLTLITGDTHE